ncbi:MULTISPECIES: hypothetical protein [Vibrio]|nr:MULTISPECIES: hypothetical protein [Vibrio]EGR0171690.1 hypothetical protein [Vibrio alginolyticus]ELN6939240.1 hypothetical protein [Vibrio alginolyticus]MCA2440216.1 hypothetical protein [Vibrio alginolyticus]MDW1730562.1 hypothetical protein [Vibrio sp. Vb2356]MDW1932813.1 hypothetical protein [Vibrio sp. 970]
MNKFEIGQDPTIPLGEKLSLLYDNSSLTRALVMLLPGGGIVDMFACKPAQKYAQEKLNLLIKELRSEIALNNAHKLSIEDEEQFFNIFLKVCTKTITTRTNQKIRYFAHILSRSTYEDEVNWDEVESLVGIVDSITDTHITILKTFTDLCTHEVGTTKRVSFIDATSSQTLSKLPDIEVSAIKMYLADLVSKGLLYDEGIGRADARALQLLRPNETSYWFIHWIKGQAS